MKKIRTEVSYKVPHWAFCNSDMNEMVDVPKEVCKFCVSKKGGERRCLLYDESLTVVDGLVRKAEGCKKATAGIRSVIETDRVAATGPTVPPKELIKQTIDLYSRTVNDLLKQGYPRPIAEQVAKKHTLGG